MSDDGRAKAEHFLGLANEIYKLANEVTDAETRRILLELALAYDRLAWLVEAREQSPLATPVSDWKKS